MMLVISFAIYSCGYCALIHPLICQSLSQPPSSLCGHSYDYHSSSHILARRTMVRPATASRAPRRLLHQVQPAPTRRDKPRPALPRLVDTSRRRSSHTRTTPRFGPRHRRPPALRHHSPPALYPAGPPCHRPALPRLLPVSCRPLARHSHKPRPARHSPSPPPHPLLLLSPLLRHMNPQRTPRAQMLTF